MPDDPIMPRLRELGLAKMLLDVTEDGSFVAELNMAGGKVVVYRRPYRTEPAQEWHDVVHAMPHGGGEGHPPWSWIIGWDDAAEETYRRGGPRGDITGAFILDDVLSHSDTFTCPECGAISHNPRDVEHGYCGRCHAFTGRAVGSILRVPRSWDELERLRLAAQAEPSPDGPTLHESPPEAPAGDEEEQ